MSPDRGSIANVVLKSNLLSVNYPDELHRVSAFELNDIKDRNPLLPFNLDPTSYDGVTPNQRRQWDSRLKWGNCPIELTEARRLGWLEAQAGALIDHLGEIAGRVGEEQAFEILYLVAELRRVRSPLADRAAGAETRALEVLRGGAFGRSDAEIEQRLALILGDPDLRLE